ncbi:hypothetical protein LUZ60_009820 [Juncus effusus]|nr:hypothetical protein LUZ60_009820 [Juncus effusus]
MASAPSPSSFPSKTSESISPTTASQSSPPPLSLSAAPPPPVSQPNATPADNPAPPLASPPLSSPPPPILSPPLPSLSPPLPPLSPPPPVPTVPTLSPPPPQTTTPQTPPLPSSPPLSPPIISPPPVSLSPPPSSQPTPTVPTVPPPKASPFSPPPPKRKRPNSPSLSSPPPPSPSLSTSPPLPSPNTNSSVPSATPPPLPQFPLATPTPQNGTISQTTPDSNNPNSSKNSNTDFNQGGNSNNSTSSNSGGSGLGLGASISITIVTTFLLASFIIAGVLYIKKKRKPVNGYNSVFIVPSPTATPSSKLESPLARFPQTPFGYNSSGSQNLVNSKYFSYEELHQLTNGFSVNNVLGEGGFGIVYKGCLPDGRQVAVKRLTAGGGQGEREFQAEVEIISRVHHRHLVSLVGYCMDNEQRVLVYDYVPNDTLHFHLHGKDRPVLEWKIRVKIAAGAARGIAYLHEDCHPRIIHRDIKSSNILLDDEFEALVADFGLARLAMDACTHVTTRVMGTFGYLAPEYASSGKLTERSDVFSFGVVLLELITGRRPVDSSRPLGDESLVEWARPLLGEAIESGKLDGIIDPRLEKNYDEVEMLRMIEAAAACVRHSSSHRPKMSQVVRVLDSLADVDLTNGVQPGKSELFNVANSAEIRLFQRMAFGNNFDYSSEFNSHTSTSVNSNSNSNLNPNLNANSNLHPNLSANLRSDYRRL